MNSPYFDPSDSEEVLMIPVTTADDFLKAWNELNDEDITDMYLYLHGGEGALYFKGLRSTLAAEILRLQT